MPFQIGKRTAGVLSFAVVLLSAASLAAQHGGHGGGWRNGTPDGLHGSVRQDEAPVDVYSDVSYLSAMVEHHQGAIDMANAELKDGKDKQARKWAKEIIKAQQSEIDRMKVWIEEMGGVDGQSAGKMGLAMSEMMMAASGANTDRGFVSVMMEHHLMAVRMAIDAIEHSNDARIVKLSRDIAGSQLDEVIYFKNWLKQNP